MKCDEGRRTYVIVEYVTGDNDNDGLSVKQHCMHLHLAVTVRDL